MRVSAGPVARASTRAASARSADVPEDRRDATTRRGWSRTPRLLVLAAVAVCASAQSPEIEFFEKKIRPVLLEQCEACHSAALEEPMGGLRVDTREGLLTGGASGPAVKPGDPQKSLLLKALSYKDPALKMPPTGKLSDAAIADFTHWIEQGAADPRAAEVSAAPAKKPAGPGTPIEEGKRWWAFQPLEEKLAPQPERRGWSKRKIDAFVLAKLEAEGLEPSPEADRRTLIRRAYLDLIGLPPSYEQIEAFAADPSPTAYEDLVDDLMRRPQYGERWGRHWLDVARWAEDHPTSESTNRPHPYAWRYRDWVIEAVNQDIPYDRFIRMQFGADLLPGFEPDDMRALGYIGNSPMYHKDPRLSRDVIETLSSDDWDERVDAVSRGLLGLTVACARCHDHKFDPITNKDYYAMAGVFASTWLAKRPIVEMDPAEADKLVWDHERAVRVGGQLGNLGELDTIAEELHPYIAELKEEINALKQRLEMDATPMTHAVVDSGVWIDGSTPTVTWIDLRPGEPRDLPVFIRGNVANPGEIVPRRFLTVFAEDEPEPFEQGSGRLDLADKIVGEAGPLAARVWVNRVWGWHFGEHLVRTPSDFGTQGQKPTHPELLDDLAARFVESGWSLKWLHREIMLSATYRQDSRLRDDANQADPTNRWLWRMNPQRLDIEAWRDSILQASGELDLAMFGESAEIDETPRRSVYARISRGRPHRMLQLYDFPDVTQHSPQRQQTTTPLQQLFVLNSEWMQQRATALAARVEEVDAPAERVEALYRLTLGREPSASELRLALDFLAGGERWTQYAQALLGTNESSFQR